MIVAAQEAIERSPAPYGPIMTAVSFAFIAAGFPVLLSLAWRDVVIGAALSLVVYAIALLSGRSPRLARMLLRRLVGPITLWKDEPLPGWLKQKVVKWRAESKVAGALNVQLDQSPRGSRIS